MVKLNKSSKMRLLLLVLLALTGSCEKEIIRRDDELSLPRASYVGNQLRLDGYYYLKKGNDLFHSYFFYRNGVMLDGGGNAPNSLPFEFVENNFRSTEWIDVVKNNKSSWGIFLIDGREIAFERYYPTSGPPAKAYIRAGEVLNDTTFVITKSYRVVDGQETELTQRSEVYHFKEFSPKPDSTNRFVE